MTIRFVLHRPRNAGNIGSAARALANTGAGPLWVVEAEQFDRTQAARLAAGADATLDAMQVVRTLDEAIAPCVDLVFTTGRVVEGMPSLTPREAAQRLLAVERRAQASAAGGSGSEVQTAIVFGDEVRGLTNEQLRRANAVATIPTVEKASLNLAQSVLVFAYEVMLARGDGKAGQETGKESNREKQRAAHALAKTQRAAPHPSEPRGSASEGVTDAEPALRDLSAASLAEDRLHVVLREQMRSLLLERGFLNPKQPDLILDELLRVIRRSMPSRRELELWIGAFKQIGREK